MKKAGIIIFAVAIVIGLVVTNMFSFGRISDRYFNFSLNFGGVHGSGKTATEARDLTGFKAVDVGGVFQVEIVAQKDFRVEVEADDNLLPLIKTEVDGNVLKINAERRLSSSNPIKIRIYAPDIDNLEVSGAANVSMTDIKNDNLTLDCSGHSNIKIAGETSKLNIDVSGSTKIDAEALRTVDANVDAGGASGVTVNVSGELRSEASGASKILYTGTPSNVIKETHGASRVAQK